MYVVNAIVMLNGLVNFMTIKELIRCLQDFEKRNLDHLDIEIEYDGPETYTSLSINGIYMDSSNTKVVISNIYKD